MWVSVLIIIYCQWNLLRYGLRDALIYGYNSKAIGDSSVLCPLSSIIVVSSPLGPLTYMTIISCPDNDARYRFHLVEQDLNLIRRWLVIAMTFVPLLY